MSAKPVEAKDDGGVAKLVFSLGGDDATAFYIARAATPDDEATTARNEDGGGRANLGWIPDNAGSRGRGELCRRGDGD